MLRALFAFHCPKASGSFATTLCETQSAKGRQKHQASRRKRNFSGIDVVDTPADVPLSAVRNTYDLKRVENDILTKSDCHNLSVTVHLCRVDLLNGHNVAIKIRRESEEFGRVGDLFVRAVDIGDIKAQIIDVGRE